MSEEMSRFEQDMEDAMQQFRDERHKAVMAVQTALTDSETSHILEATQFLYPNLHGGGVADILDILSDHDRHLFWTEHLYDDNMEEIEALEQQGTSRYLWTFAMQACIMKGPLFEEVARLVKRAQEILDQGRGE